jgi:predicted nucleic acid-binding protein
MDIAIEFGEPLPDWVIIEKVSDKYRQQLLEMQIDKGESSAIALALETLTKI